MGQCTSGGAGSRGIEDARAQGKSLNGALKSDVDRVKSEMSEKSGNQTAADDDADYIYDAGITRTRSFIAEHVETHYTIEEELGAFTGQDDASYLRFGRRSRSVRHSFQRETQENRPGEVLNTRARSDRCLSVFRLSLSK